MGKPNICTLRRLIITLTEKRTYYYNLKTHIEHNFRVKRLSCLPILASLSFLRVYTWPGQYEKCEFLKCEKSAEVFLGHRNQFLKVAVFSGPMKNSKSSKFVQQNSATNAISRFYCLEKSFRRFYTRYSIVVQDFALSMKDYRRITEHIMKYCIV